ncbi:MAG: cobalamin-independent methionine synthase II family protein [Rhodospirillales bacterium]|nr:MAG: cobalamin-independent methionine synthase II family protein [Rhodospirillales bacterium]
MPTLPPLPTMGVGSYASPGWFISGRGRARDGDFGPADIDELYEDATRIAIADQVEAGLDIVSDGELRRQRFVFEVFGRLSGLKRVPPDRKLGVPGYDMAPHFAVDGGVEAPRGLGVVEEFVTLKRLAPGRALKVAFPGPLTFAGFMTAGGRDPGAVLEELIAIVRAELAGLQAAGADYIQLDEPGLPENPFGLSLDDAVTVVNRAMAGCDTRRAVHVCFGNNAGRPMADRDIQRLVPALLGLDVEEVSLEYANREMAQIETVGALAARFDVGVGVVDVKNFHLETPEKVADRIALAARHAPVERLRVTADCGFSALPRGLARRKMTAMVEGARLARRRMGLV